MAAGLTIHLQDLAQHSSPALCMGAILSSLPSGTSFCLPQSRPLRSQSEDRLGSLSRCSCLVSGLSRGPLLGSCETGWPDWAGKGEALSRVCAFLWHPPAGSGTLSYLLNWSLTELKDPGPGGHTAIPASAQPPVTNVASAPSSSNKALAFLPASACSLSFQPKKQICLPY